MIFKKLKNYVPAFLLFTFILISWQLVWVFELVPRFILPSPLECVKVFVNDFRVLVFHSMITLSETFFGLLFGVVFGFVSAFLMDKVEFIKKALYPLIIVSQTIPTIAIAPLLVLWLGYGFLPKVVLIALATFFPISISLLSSFANCDKDLINLFLSMGANQNQIFYHVKLPSSIEHFFSALKISVSYSIISAVTAEWLGGYNGLGVYMIRVKKSYSFDKMFAVIFIISFISLIIIKGVSLLEKKVSPWKN